MLAKASLSLSTASILTVLSGIVTAQVPQQIGAVAVGITVNQPTATDIERWKTKAKDGDADMMVNLGSAYYHGLGVDVDKTQAFKWFLMAADKEDTAAMRNVGMMLFKGEGTAKDHLRAEQWLRKAADRKDRQALFILAGLYDERGTEVEREKAFTLYLQASELGHAPAMTCLGLMYQKGEGTPRDETQAFIWLSKAAEAGEPDGMASLGAAYGEGMGTAKNGVLSVEWSRKAAAAGNAQGMYNLATSYYDGSGVEKNRKTAYEWFKKAAENGNAKAMHYAGLILYNGVEGLPRDEAAGKRWVSRAADAGYEPAKQVLIQMK